MRIALAAHKRNGSGRLSARARAAASFALAAATAIMVLLCLLPVSARAVSYTAQEIALVQLINDYRTGNGLDALLVSDLLSDAAGKHSNDMGTFGFFGHATVASSWFPAGSSPGNRMVACGYPEYVPWGENVAAGYPGAVEVFTAWKNSDTHNRNMLAATWRVIGVGVESVGGSEYGSYWTTDFGASVDGTAHLPGEPAPTDTTAPIVLITAPVAGSDVAGLVNVRASASDNLGVTKVDLLVNGTLLASDAESPYAFVWDSAGLTPGVYELKAEAHDAAGNIGETLVLIHVSRAPPSSTTTTTELPSVTTTTAPTGTTTTTSLPTAPTFPDVPATHQFYQPISSLAAAAVVCGKGDGLFHPDDYLTRAQFAKIIVLALGRHTDEVEHPSVPTFADVPYAGNAYPFDYVEEAAELGIIRGYGDGTFRPQQTITRLQVALMLVRAAEGALPVPPSGYACPYSDVPYGSRETIRTAAYSGILTSKNPTTFAPYARAVRGEAAKMVYELSKVLED